ncbi:hypothetical protein LP419_14905 [Massilia sp. H-1]|nr:hypothetical protein LP419_14905 [Massilia sp. H-1]
MSRSRTTLLSLLLLPASLASAADTALSAAVARLRHPARPPVRLPAPQS